MTRLPKLIAVRLFLGALNAMLTIYDMPSVQAVEYYLFLKRQKK